MYEVSDRSHIIALRKNNHLLIPVRTGIGISTCSLFCLASVLLFRYTYDPRYTFVPGNFGPPCIKEVKKFLRTGTNNNQPAAIKDENTMEIPMQELEKGVFNGSSRLFYSYQNMLVGSVRASGVQ